MAKQSKVVSGNTTTYTITDQAGNTATVAVTVNPGNGFATTLGGTGNVENDGMAMVAQLVLLTSTNLLP